MPQMAPINWMILFIFFLSMIFMFNILNYFNIKIMESKDAMPKKIKISPINWKW